MGEMSVHGLKGDTKIIWDPENPDEVENARECFNRLKAKRYVPFSVGRKGNKDERLTEFDPAEEKIIFTMPMAGGAGHAIC